ncbi:MAG: hypothetical protein R2746_02245 [Acidimicrobiales bacterium]
MWDDADLPLKGLARAMYREGRFTAIDGGTATIVFPNPVHRDKCEGKRAEVEQALSTRFGVPISLRLQADGDSGGSVGARPADGSGGGGPERGPVAPSPDPDPDDDVPLAIADVRELPDAPSAATGGIDALTEAFPGAEFVE